MCRVAAIACRPITVCPYALSNCAGPRASIAIFAERILRLRSDLEVVAYASKATSHKPASIAPTA
jgi:hypothetical protein